MAAPHRGSERGGPSPLRVQASFRASRATLRSPPRRGLVLEAEDEESVEDGHSINHVVREHVAQAMLSLKDEQATPAQVEEGLARVQRAIFLKPADGTLYITRAELYLKLGDVKSAIIDLRHAVQLNPRDHTLTAKLAFFLDLRGMQWLQMKQCELAISSFKEASALYPNYWPFKVHLALAYVSIDELDPALQAVNACLKSCQNDREIMSVTLTGKGLQRAVLPRAEIYILRGKILWAQGSIAQSVKDLQRAEQLDASHPEVQGFIQTLRSNASDFFRTALDHMAHNDFVKAIESLTTAIEVVPDDIRALVIRAAARRRLNQYEEALDDLRAASMMYWEAMHGKPFADREMLHPNYRDTKFNEPVAITRQRNLVLNEIAVELAVKGKHGDAITLLNKVIEEEMEILLRDRHSHVKARPAHGADVDYRYLVNRGDCHRACKHIELALADYHRAHDLRPDDWNITTRLSLLHYAVGMAMYNDGQWERAKDYLTWAIKYNHKVPAYYIARGKVYYYSSEFGLAFIDFRNALKLDPGNPEIENLLQQFRSSSSEEQEALLLKLGLVQEDIGPEARKGKQVDAEAKDSPGVRRKSGKGGHVLATTSAPLQSRVGQHCAAVSNIGQDVCRTSNQEDG